MSADGVTNGKGIGAFRSLSDGYARTLRVTRPDTPKLAYYDGRRRVAAALAANGGSVDRLVADAGR